MVNPIPSRFSHFVEYYVEIEGKERIDAIPSSKGKFLKYIGNTGKDLKSFMKENGLSPKEENHLVQIFRFLDEA